LKSPQFGGNLHFLDLHNSISKRPELGHVLIFLTWNLRMMVQINPRVRRGLPSTMSSAPIDSSRTYKNISCLGYFFSKRLKDMKH